MVKTTDVYEVVGLFTPAIDLSSSDLVSTKTSGGKQAAPARWRVDRERND